MQYKNRPGGWNDYSPMTGCIDFRGIGTHLSFYFPLFKIFHTKKYAPASVENLRNEAGGLVLLRPELIVSVLRDVADPGQGLVPRLLDNL